MTRVSENSNVHAINFAVNKAKERLENLQMKGSILSNITRPSENPIANVEAMGITAATADNKQFLRNADYAKLQLNTTEKTLEQLTDILNKAKEMAIAQASDFYDGNIRKNVSMEAIQLYNQALALSNKRVGNRYIFAGHKSLTTPFSKEGDYMGDKGHIFLEVSKDFFVPINLNGHEVFYSTADFKETAEGPLKALKSNLMNTSPEGPNQQEPMNRDLASMEDKAGDPPFEKAQSVFGVLTSFIGALENNDNEQVQDLLEKFDTIVERLITLRTRVGSLVASIQSAQGIMESENVDNAEQKSRLMDADIAELFSDITKQQTVLKTTYQSGKSMLNQTLLDFLR